jgi:hypothetical protein
LSRLATSFVLGYHGCDQSVADKAVRGDVGILQSDRDFDWLGKGAYFWESDPQRALEWAKEKAKRGDYLKPAVVGAVIDLRNCLDLASRTDLHLIRQAHASFVQTQKLSGLPIPKNGSVKGNKNADRVLRFLDCAVFNHLHSILNDQPEGPARLEPFDTVRGMFTEGPKLYAGAGFRAKTHVQLAVRNPACIVGLFNPRAPSGT